MERLHGNRTEGFQKLRPVNNLREFWILVGTASLICATSFGVPCGTQALAAQHKPPSQRELAAFAERAHREARTGKLVAVPREIVGDRVESDPQNQPPCDHATADQLRAYSFTATRQSQGVLAIQGVGYCQCSPTGNCSFWIFRRVNGKYGSILDRDVVQVFSFLKSQTHGYPDVVTWSHGSATDHGSTLFRFDGHEYQESLGWDEEYERWLDDGSVEILKKPQVTLVYWDGKAIPK